jgi:ankyrin repeat protein
MGGVTLGSLPTELIEIVIQNLDACRDVLASMRLCRRLYLIARAFLYQCSGAPSLDRILFWAIAANQVGTAKTVLKAGANPRTWFQVRHAQRFLRKNEPPPCFYVRRSSDSTGSGNLEPALQFGSTYSALALAVRNRSLELAELLLDNGASIDARCTQFCCSDLPMHHPPFHSMFSRHWTALHVACCSGYPEIAQLLVERGAAVLGDAGRPLRRALPIPSAAHLPPGGVPYALPFPQGVPHAGSTPVLPQSLPPGLGISQGANALHIACACGDLSTARFLVEKGHVKDFEAQDFSGYTPLWYAFVRDKWECFEWLLSLGANINLCARKAPSGAPLLKPHQPTYDAGYYSSLLDYAIFTSRFDDACKLIDLGIDIRTTLSTHRSPLHSCCDIAKRPPYVGPDVGLARLRLMTRLLKEGLDIDTRIEHGMTALHVAVQCQDFSAVDLLLSHGANVDLAVEGGKNKGDTALWLACRVAPPPALPRRPRTRQVRAGGPSPVIVRRLLQSGARVNDPLHDGLQLIQRVCKCHRQMPNKAQILRLLVTRTKAFDVNIDFVRSLVFDCFAMGDGRSLNVILENIVWSRLSLSNQDLLKLFQSVVRRPHTSCLEFLLSIDDDRVILALSTGVLNLLSMEWSKMRESVVMMLLDRGAHQNFKEHSFTVMLHQAAQFGYTDATRWLLDKGVQIDTVDSGSRSPLMHAGKADVVKLLLERGADAWLGLDHTQGSLENTAAGLAIASSNRSKLTALLSGGMSMPPCVLPKLLEMAARRGAANCFCEIYDHDPAQATRCFEENGEQYLRDLLVCFLYYEPAEFLYGTAQDMVKCVRIVTRSDCALDLERKGPTRAPLVDMCILEILEMLLKGSDNHSHRRKTVGLAWFRTLVSIYWTATSPEILINDSNSSTPSINSFRISSSRSSSDSDTDSSDSESESSDSSSDASDIVSDSESVASSHTASVPPR